MNERWLSKLFISPQENVLWEEYADGSLSIYQNVICEKDSQKVNYTINDVIITTLSMMSLLLHYQ